MNYKSEVKLVCTKADDINNYLTKGKLYSVHDQNDLSYFITDDIGNIGK